MPERDKEKEDAEVAWMSSPANVEKMVQRRVADALSSAGVSPGIISREVLFMLPTEFVQVYVEIFDRALRESTVGSGIGRQGDKANPTRRVARTGALRDSGKGGRRDSEGRPTGGDTRRGVVQVGAGTGRKFREYWTVQDELAFEVKRRLDRKLRRAAAQARAEMARGKLGRVAREHAETQEAFCRTCAMDLTTLLDAMGVELRHCPRCGASVETSASGLSG